MVMRLGADADSSALDHTLRRWDALSDSDGRQREEPLVVKTAIENDPFIVEFTHVQWNL